MDGVVKARRFHNIFLHFCIIAHSLRYDARCSPGSPAGTCTTEEATANIAACINRAHSETTSVSIILECMAGQGSHIGSTFQSLRDTIALIQCKSRIGVCLDTCHMFAAGYDVRTRVGFDAVMREFDEVVGLRYLKAMHLNDSKGELGCCRDRHENIGKGMVVMMVLCVVSLRISFNADVASAH